MYRQQFYIIANILMAFDALILIGSGYMAYTISLEVRTGGLIMAWNDFLGCVLFLMVANNYFMGRFGFYSEKRFPSTWPMITKLTIAVASGFAVLSVGAILVGIHPFPRVFVFSYFLIALMSSLITRIVLYLYLDHREKTAFNTRQILLVGTQERIEILSEALEKQRSWGHHIAGCLRVNGDCSIKEARIPLLGNLEDFDRVLFDYKIDEVIFALPKGFPLELGPYLEKCEKIGVTVRIMPAMFDLAHPTMRVESIQSIPTLAYYTNGSPNASALLYKRILDFFAGIIGVLIFLIIYPIVGLAIKLDSPGPVLFKQRRVARNGRIFDLYKFRTMTADAESKKADLLVEKDMPWPIYKNEDDPRVTRVGRFLRKTSLDEFPQFINVLKGQMSLVGTRPPTPNEVKAYQDWHRRRISMKPGMTGLWQVSGRKEIKDFDKVVELDLQYIDGWRFRNDLEILLKTAWVVLAGKGAK